MSKSDHKQAEDILTGENSIAIGRYCYMKAVEMENNEDQNQKKIDALWKSSAKCFFDAMALGHNEASRCFAVSFNQGTGVTKDKDVAALFYGVALELEVKDLKKCNAIAEEMPKIPESMESAIHEIAKFIQNTPSKIKVCGLDTAALTKRGDELEEKIALLTGKLISALLYSDDIAQESIAKFSAEHPGWVYHAPDTGGGAAAGGADSHLAAAFSDLHH